MVLLIWRTLILAAASRSSCTTATAPHISWIGKHPPSSSRSPRTENPPTLLIRTRTAVQSQHTSREQPQSPIMSIKQSSISATPIRSAAPNAVEAQQHSSATKDDERKRGRKFCRSSNKMEYLPRQILGAPARRTSNTGSITATSKRADALHDSWTAAARTQALFFCAEGTGEGGGSKINFSLAV
ncbi:hypothetical protein IWZ00DRAFT_487811 [Phyllosticta capitalensis]|uniref:Secreted protein n=1 Tax=Phyllosticta capitalensis TaxID=121624 RepID=A0ABR1YXT6_9PEZI